MPRPGRRRPLTTRAAPPRAWQRMLSGRRLDLLDPSPMDVEIGDIAHGLARVARWNGQTRGDYIFSVAQHSLLVEKIAVALDPSIGRADRLFLLLHDAPEYVIGDMISPFKAVIGDAYKSVENRILSAILLRFLVAAASRAGDPAPVQKGRSRGGFFRGCPPRRLYTQRSGAHFPSSDDFAAGVPGGSRAGADRRGGARFSGAFSGHRRDGDAASMRDEAT